MSLYFNISIPKATHIQNELRAKLDVYRSSIAYNRIDGANIKKRTGKYRIPKTIRFVQVLVNRFRERELPEVYHQL